ncbi:MAG: ABC transporter permease subunit [Acutalibacteraceae bacterium]
MPKSYREASLGLGATPIRTIFKVTIPAARSGILSGVILVLAEQLVKLWL